MLTCKDIINKAVELTARTGVSIEQENYSAIAEKIHPRVVMPKLPALNEFESYAILKAVHEEVPEAEERRRAQQMQTEDWTDLLVACVTGWQYNAVFENFLVRKGYRDRWAGIQSEAAAQKPGRVLITKTPALSERHGVEAWAIFPISFIENDPEAPGRPIWHIIGAAGESVALLDSEAIPVY